MTDTEINNGDMPTVKRGRGRPKKAPIPEKYGTFQFVIPAANPDDGDYTKHFLKSGFDRALGPYGSVDFNFVERDDGFITITGNGTFAVPETLYDELCIDLTLVSVSWRKALLIVDGKALLNGNQTLNGIPFVVLENLERYLKLNGKKQPK